MAVFTSSGTENLMRWDGHSRPFMEVWYCTLGHWASGAGAWLRYTISAPAEGDPYCELWGFLFDPEHKLDFAGKQRFAIDHLARPHGRDDGAIVRIDDSWLSESHVEGRLERDGRRFAWSLDLDPSDRAFHHLPDLVSRRAERKLSTLCSPNLAVPFTGTVTIDDRVLEFDRDAGSQTHRWGRRHSLTWTWCHCSSFEGAEAIFEGLAAKAPLGPIRPTTTFVFLRYDDADIAFNELRWALRAKSRYDMPTWAFTARTDEWKIAGAARAAQENLVQVRYDDPDGSQRYCANTEIGDLAIEIYHREGAAWRHHGSLTALKRAHMEFGRQQPFAELPVAF